MTREQTTAPRLELACDQQEGEAFAAWLTGRGHDVTIGRSTGSYVDGVPTTDHDEPAGAVLGGLWDAYCAGEPTHGEA